MSEARSEYNSEFGGDIDYDDEYNCEVCADCAILDTDSNINLGSAIGMMNGDEDFDKDIVEQYF